MPTWTQADVAALRAAVASGVLRVIYHGPPMRSMEYQSLREMRALLSQMEQDVARAAGTSTAYRLVSTSKGLGCSYDQD